MVDIVEIAPKVMEARLAACLTQGELAKKVGKDIFYINQIELGEMKSADEKVLAKIAETLKVKL